MLAGRGNAERLRGRIEAAARAAEEPVVLDFDGVITVSPSFADELFAKLDASVKDSGQVEVRGMGPALESLARFVRAGRPAGA